MPSEPQSPTHQEILRTLHTRGDRFIETSGQCDCACADCDCACTELAIQDCACLPEAPRPTPTLTAWLHLTDRCNLRCAYCYLPHAPADMAPATGRDAVAATFRSAHTHSYRRVKLKYAGGEPLLAFPQIQSLHGYARTLAKQQGVELEGVVLTNGTLLTPEIIAGMQALGLKLMVSLDGAGPAHDAQRPYTDGHGSFADVRRGIATAFAGGLVPNVSVTVTGRSAAGLPETVAWLLAHRLPFGLNFYREHDRAAEQRDLRLEEERIVAGMLAAYQVIASDIPAYSMLTSLADRANLAVPHRRTCGACRDYLVFDTQGRVAKCQMDIHHPVAHCRDADPLGVLRDCSQGMSNPEVTEKDVCRECEWRYWCAGGCPLEAYRTTGRYDAPSPNCAIYRALYPEIVRLEGLRLYA